MTSRLDRAVQRMAGSDWFAKVGPTFVPKLDRFLSRITGGRFVMSQRMVPSMVLHSTGAKSGLPRESPLATLPDGDAFYVVGSNFGKEGHPAWTANLLAHPDVEVVHKGKRTRHTAHLLDADEKRAVWPRLTAMWPVYDRYEEKSGRDLRVFRLDPRT